MLLLMDLSKAYDYVNYDLIIAKLEAYGVGGKSLRLIQNNLSQRQQGVKLGSSFSEWLDYPWDSTGKETLKRTFLLMEKPLNHQIQLNYLELPWTKTLILNDIYKIFAAKQIIKPEPFYV